MEEFLTVAIALSKRLIGSSDPKLLDIINSENSKDVYLTVPDVIFSLFERALYVCEVFNFSAQQLQTLNWLYNINIFPSADWAITLYHKDYSIDKELWMIRKIAITNTIKVFDKSFNEEITYLNEIINASRERIELN